MVSANDLKVYKTTNFLGGPITGTLVQLASPNNIFTNIPYNELVVGEDYYACVYLKNTNGSEAMENFTVWLSSKSFPHDTHIQWGGDPSDVAQIIPNKYTEPSGVDWKDVGIKRNFGHFPAGEDLAIWLWLHVDANAEQRADDNCIFTFTTGIPQGGSGSGGGGSGGSGVGYAYDPYGTFNGTSDFVTQADSAALDLVQFSVSCWFRTSTDTTGISSVLVNKSGFGSSNYIVFIEGNKIYAGFESSGGANNYAVSPLSYNDGLWHFVCVTYDQASVILYIDGVSVATFPASATPVTSADPLVIGRNGTGSFDFFQGNIDEVRVWNNDLTAAEVLDLYTSGVVPQSGAMVYENTFAGSGSGGGGSGGTGGNPPPTNTNYKIAICGDWGCETATNNVITLIKNQGYNVLVGGGDNAYESASCWTSKFKSLKDSGVFRHSAYGNHEYSETGGVSPYKTFFGDAKTYHSFQYQNMFFLIIDDNDFEDGSAPSLSVGSTQYNWIVSELNRVKTDSTITWKVAILHHPWYGDGAAHPANEGNQVQDLNSLFQNNGINFVVTFHNHNWQRSHKVSYNSGDPKSPHVVDSSSPYSRTTTGLIAVVSGTGGHDSGSGLYSLPSNESFWAYLNKTHNGVWEMIASNNGQTLTCSFVDTNGTKYDTFTIA